MCIAILKLELHIPASQSLKHKRLILNSFKGKLRNNFNVSIAEVGGHDKWQRAVIAVCQIGSEKGYIHGAMEKVLDFAERFNGVSLLKHEMEIM